MFSIFKKKTEPADGAGTVFTEVAFTDIPGLKPAAGRPQAVDVALQPAAAPEAPSPTPEGAASSAGTLGPEAAPPVSEVAVEPASAPAAAARQGWISRLREGLRKTG
ncbi:MAG: hypothetical protein O9335_13690, partial [Inhella sp.]|nr:hypothetical protein [Inhella sp.]